MSGAQFTKGPWEVFDDGDRFEVAVGQLGEDRICEPLGDTPEQAEANGRLIAAAPELYAACEAAEFFLGNIGGGPRAEVGKQVRAALAKARGETA